MSDPAHVATPQHILVTGAAGAVGQLAVRVLRAEGHVVRGFDCRPAPDAGEHVLGDLADAAAVSAAVAGCQTVVHLGAVPDDADFLAKLLPANIVGAFHVFDAARVHGVKRLIVASTGQVVGGRRRQPPPRLVSEVPMPTNHYAVTKVFAEAMGVMYHHRYQMDVMMARIGWFVRNAVEAGHMIEWPGGQQIYVSHADMAQFFVKAVAAPPFGYQVVFVTSKSPRETVFDLAPVRAACGYEPVDTYPGGLPEGWPRA